MGYNLSLLQSNESTILTLVQVTNEASGNLLVGGFLIAVFLVQAVLFTRAGASSLGAVTFSSWLSFLYSLFFLLASDTSGSLINFWFVLGFGVTAPLGTLLLYLQKN